MPTVKAEGISQPYVTIYSIEYLDGNWEIFMLEFNQSPNQLILAKKHIEFRQNHSDMLHKFDGILLLSGKN